MLLVGRLKAIPVMIFKNILYNNSTYKNSICNWHFKLSLNSYFVYFWSTKDNCFRRSHNRMLSHLPTTQINSFFWTNRLSEWINDSPIKSYLFCSWRNQCPSKWISWMNNLLNDSLIKFSYTYCRKYVTLPLMNRLRVCLERTNRQVEWNKHWKLPVLLESIRTSHSRNAAWSIKFQN